MEFKPFKLRSFLRSHLETTLLVFIWWAGNSLYAVDAQKLLTRYDSTLLFFDLGLMQISLGAILSYLHLRYTQTPVEESIADVDRSQTSKRSIHISATLVAAGLCNFVGTLLTNASYKILGSTSTLVWKLSEPLAVIVLKYTILKQSTSAGSVVGVLHLVGGVLIFSWSNNRKPLSTSPILIANLAYPARNVLVKLDQSSLTVQRTSTEGFLALQLSSMPFMLSVFIVKAAIAGVSLEPFPLLLRNALLFNSYQFASMMLLQRLDPLTHAIGNTFKRFSGILLSVLLTREVLPRMHVKGLLLALIGFCLYVVGGKSFRSKPLLARRTQYLCAAASLAILIHTYPSYANEMIHDASELLHRSETRHVQ